MTCEEAQAAVRTEKAERHAAETYVRLHHAAERNPNGKLARKAADLLADRQRFGAWVSECGGESGALDFIIAEVYSGVLLSALCEANGLNRGVLYAWMMREDERWGLYERALQARADEYAVEAVPVADGTIEVTAGASVKDRKLSAETRLASAKQLDRKRFGEREAGVTIDLRDRLKPADIEAEMRALVAANPALRAQMAKVIEGEVVGAESASS